MEDRASKVRVHIFCLSRELTEGWSDNDGFGQSAVPKFASFRPQPTPVKSDQECGKFLDPRQDGPPKHGEYRSTSGARSGRQYSHAATQLKTPGSTVLDQAGDLKDLAFAFPHNHATSPDERREPKSFFIVDKGGDTLNLEFGTLHTYATPLYFRFGAGNVLGVPINQKIDRKVSSEKGLVLSRKQDGSSKGLRISSAQKVGLDGSRELKIKPRPSSGRLDSGADFVSFVDAQGKKGNRTHDGSSVGSSSEGDDSHYRSLEGKFKVKDEPDDTDLTYWSHEEKGNYPSKLAGVQSKRSELSKKIDADPTNVDAWLELVKQYHYVSGTPTNAERRSNADIKLSIYEKALSKVKEFNGRELLLIGRMNEGAQIWDRQKSLSEWQSIMQSNPGYPRLWKNYLDFRQNDFESFRYEEVRNTFVDCLYLLRRKKIASESLLEQKQRIYEIQIYIFLRMTIFMRETGFCEQALSSWQTLLEYEHNKPSKLQHSNYKEGGPLHQEAVSGFEQFWDSEVPRIGEEDYNGWASFCLEANSPHNPKMDIAGTVKDSQDMWQSWAESECERSLSSRNPARIIDDLVEDDPYRLILFSDIKPFLIDSPSVESHAVCLDAFLAFCYLPPCQEKDPNGKSRSLWRDGYIRNETLYVETEALQSWIIPSSEGCRVELTRPKVAKTSSSTKLPRRSIFDPPIPDYQLSSDSLFASRGSWFAAFDEWENLFSGDRGPLPKSWVLQCLKQLVAIDVGGNSLAEYCLALELRLSPDTVKKTARALLKKRSSSLLLYKAYALIESRLGNRGKAETTIVTSIQMAKGLDDSAQRESISLWRTWLWELLMANGAKEALLRIMQYGNEGNQSASPAINPLEQEDLSPALFLRTERALTATRDHMLVLRSYRHAAAAIECLVLFQYIQTAASLSMATSTFTSNTSILTTQDSQSPTSLAALELLHQSFARLIYYHVTHNRLVKSSEIRFLLAESIALFPQNTIFLSLYTWNEARFRIDDRVRSIIKDVVLNSNQDTAAVQRESLLSHFFAIHTELNRSITLGSNILTIRNTFERAVRSESGAHCAGLWKAYFLFEQSQIDDDKAKSVFWRAIKACPWAKALYMLAFQHLRGNNGLTDDELRGVYELMGEKEIRIHVSLDETFEAIQRETAIA